MKTKIIGLVAVALLAMAPLAAADSKTAQQDAPCNIITQSLFEYLACEGGSTVRDVCDDLFGPLNCDGVGMARMAAASAPCNIITQSLFEYIACIGGQEVRELCDEIFGSGNCDSLTFSTMTFATPASEDAPCSLIYQGLVEYLACVGGREVRDVCDDIFGSGNCDGIGVGGMTMSASAPCSLIYQGLVEYIACVGGDWVRWACDTVFGPLNCDTLGVVRN